MAAKVDFRRYLEPVCAALADLGVQAVLSGRNDIEAKGRKISGSGQMLRRGKVLHHGTLLIDVNFERLVEALNVGPGKCAPRALPRCVRGWAIFRNTGVPVVISRP